MKLAGGRQDQYAAAFGGFNFIEFHRDSTLVNPLRIRPEVIAELEYRLLLCYMGQTRQSAQIIQRQVDSYREGKSSTVEALHELKAETLDMKRALLVGDVDAMGELLHQAWEHKKRLDHAISNSHVDRLYQLARKEGAIGGKMPGAGGGGYFLLLTRFDRWRRVAERFEAFAPGAVILKWWMPFFAPAFASSVGPLRRRGTRVVLVCDNLVPHERRPFDGALTRWMLRNSDGYLVMSDSVERDLERLKPGALSRRVAHPLYTQFDRGRWTRETARAALGVDGDVALFFGFIRRYKGLDTLLEAWPQVRARRPATLIVAGEPYED